ncbi:MAG: hypothetical protein JXR48_03845 [Candidatus Delongbacteria bacterium]|nr:hypothetical protein [Candidatus Delongbacteria bacterium]MBN2834079.1 hypothetical protein [Candidatus Delongbacteria bacterium]
MISEPAKDWLLATESLIDVVAECGSCWCEFDSIYNRYPDESEIAIYLTIKSFDNSKLF